jgi:hypothetical protein
MSAVAVVFAWIGLALGVGVLFLVTALLNRVLRPIREIKRYADDTLQAGLGTAQNLDGIDEALRTRDLAIASPPLVRAYLGRVLEGRA